MIALTITIKTTPAQRSRILLALIIMTAMFTLIPKRSKANSLDTPPSPSETAADRAPLSGERLEGLMRGMNSHGGMAGMPADMAPSGGVVQAVPGRENQRSGERQWQAHDDQVFLTMMIVHHEAALEMAQAEVNSGKSAQLVKMAENIISTQDDEIKLMKTMLEKLGGFDQTAHDRMTREMSHMSSMTTSSDPDVNFALVMIQHHAGAVQLSLPPLALSANPQIRRLAEEIILAQTREIARFKQWLQDKPQVQG